MPLYVMTSPSNDPETRRYFAEHGRFGLPQEDVSFFAQNTLPCLGEGAGGRSAHPDGGTSVGGPRAGWKRGVYRSLASSGMLDEIGRRGIRHLHFVSVDNILGRPADPVFIGHCIDRNADVGNKAVWRRAANEKVGVLAVEINDDDKDIRRPSIVEYSDLSDDMRRQVDADGKLVFGAGYVCSHYFTYDFIKHAVLPGMDCLYHVAKKKYKFTT